MFNPILNSPPPTVIRQVENPQASIPKPPVTKLRFSGQHDIGHETFIEAAKKQFRDQIDETQLREALHQKKPIRLKDGTEVLYGSVHNNQVLSPFPKAQKLMTAGLTGLNTDRPISTPFFVEVGSPQTEAALHTLIQDLLPGHLRDSYIDSKTKLESTNVIYSDLLEKLLLNDTQALPPELKNDLERAFQGQQVQAPSHAASGTPPKSLDFQALENLYAIRIPGQTSSLDTPQSKGIRQQLIGLDLARKVYAEGQAIEWESIALGLAIGGIAEPAVSHVFKDGGTTASIIRTTVLSGVDITGNVLSVMGVISEKLKEKGKKLSLESILGPKEQRTWKSLFEMKGDAGPDMKQGIKMGVGGGMFGVLYNIPVGMLLSQPNGEVLPRAIVGGLSSTGSAVAIPSAIKSSREGFAENIRHLLASGKILPPKGMKDEEFVQKLALKEMNTRIGYASSAKAAHPVPLLGMGAVILSAEALGVPREYVQTLYMCLAPVMHNFIRLLYTGLEKWHTIPNRMKQLEQLVLKDDKDSTQDRQKALNEALLNGTGMTKFLTNTAGVILAGVTFLAAELLVFHYAYNKNKAAAQARKQQANKTPPANARPQPTRPHHIHATEFGYARPFTQHKPHPITYPTYPAWQPIYPNTMQNPIWQNPNTPNPFYVPNAAVYPSPWQSGFMKQSRQCQ